MSALIAPLRRRLRPAPRRRYPAVAGVGGLRHPFARAIGPPRHARGHERIRLLRGEPSVEHETVEHAGEHFGAGLGASRVAIPARRIGRRSRMKVVAIWVVSPIGWPKLRCNVNRLLRRCYADKTM